MKVSVLGSGAWGGTLAGVLRKNGHDVTLNSLRKGDIDFGALARSELVLFVCASYAMREVAAKVRAAIAPDAVVLSCAKGMEISTGLRLSQVLEEELGGGAANKARIAVLTGPQHAEEVAKELPTGSIVASSNAAAAEFAQDALMSEFLRIYTSDDVIGAELCAAFKNVMAIAVGISDGLGFGDNTKAMLMTRGLHEMSLLCERFGGKRETCGGLAGAGDLFVTCTSAHSRNRRAGLNIGGGMSVPDAMTDVGAVVEGYYAAAAAVEIESKFGMELPICSQIYKILYEGKSPAAATAELMNRDRKKEHM